MLGLSISEILLIALIALVLFGNEKLPENLRKFAKAFAKAKSVLFDMNNSWQEVKSDIKKNIVLEEETKSLKELTKPIEIVSQEEVDEITQNYSGKHTLETSTKKLGPKPE